MLTLCVRTAGLEIDVRQELRDIGPIALHISSPHLTVASLIFLGITLESPPEGLKIMSVQAFVRQQFEIHCECASPSSLLLGGRLFSITLLDD
jgi:hypothetical protein